MKFSKLLTFEITQSPSCYHVAIFSNKISIRPTDYNKPKRAVCNGGCERMEPTKENFNFRLKKNISKVKFTFEMLKWQLGPIKRKKRNVNKRFFKKTLNKKKN